LIAVASTGWRSPDTAAKLAAVFAAAALIEDSFVIYTPSAGNGLIQLGIPKGGPRISKVIEKESNSLLFMLGREVCRDWVRSMLSSPAEIADQRGLLLVQQVDLKPEILLENLDTMTFKKFSDALAELASDKTVKVVGK
jgi:hypothetical protein